MRYIILGTAGHIDHGKSALVKALTGVDPDRLKEEKERGITIDLGFADIHYPDGLTVGIVDVPGHERLVRNMLAGAGGIDIVLLVIAADEGVMPQSREHLAICDLLDIKSGIVAITKADLVEEDWLELVRDEVRDFVKGTFLEGAGIIDVSSKTGRNIDLLKEEIHRISLQVRPKSAGGPFRLPIDRVFTLKGFGTVVTGTALSGSLSVDDPVQILPGEIKSKVRGLQSHGTPINKAYAGQRVAVNLQGVQKEELRRGAVVVEPGRFRPTRAVDAELTMLEDAPVLKDRSRVHFHLSTTEAVGRVILYDCSELKPGGRSFCQIRLEEPVLAVSGDRFIIRRFSPVVTIGGGVILDSQARRRRKREGLEDLKVYRDGSLAEKIATKVKKSGVRGMTRHQLQGWINADTAEIDTVTDGLKRDGILVRFDDRLIHRDIFQGLRERIADTLRRFHENNPLKPGMSKEVLRTLFGLEQRTFQGVLSIMDEVVVDRDTVRLADFTVAVTDTFREMKNEVVKLLGQKGFQPPTKEELAEYFGLGVKEMEDILRLMAQEGAVARITDSVYLLREDYERMLGLLREYYAEKETMSVGEFRDLLGTTRKYALPFLEHLDSNRITLRVGDVRKIHPAFAK
ncbi:MAG TPA: selenocysteine-specific translation elongation factor [Nitrospirae bacterium]|nr:selenocysteine-specific translation elongation factor [Nitrospirota bacterium]